ncbi:5-formyltetrahydrofolate cyclo-ligase [Aplysia californica]|uniref:5-formyltetrahydrofolate cyclo-ligase n=1 Tax=Aplysia californica TaxID=6500 RepID=A0ABM0K1S1_APLCA|nr:5-formyltetrahydrofolate cyclo-ligase [Aplysia californica]
MSQTIQQTKAVLRKEMKQRLARLTDHEKSVQSLIILRKVLSSEVYAQSKRISIYLPMKEEVCTLNILKSMFRDGKECFIPNYKGAEMIMVPLKSWDAYERLPVTKWGIKQSEEFDASQDANMSGGLDLIFMPGLAFTTQGARLGRGKGYYDQYLNKCDQSGCLPKTVALLFHEQLTENVPVLEHDKLVDSLIFPTQEEIELER